MADFLFLQRFGAGAIERMPFDKVARVLGEYGTGRNVSGGMEFDVDGDDLASTVFVVGDASNGASCVAVLEPRYGDSLRRLALQCMNEFGCVAVDDTLTRLFVPAKGGAVENLPAAIRETAGGVLRRVSEPGQLWPEWAEMPFDGADRVALVRGASGDQPAIVQLFDHFDPSTKLMQVNVSMVEQACNAGTTGALGMLEDRVGLVLDANPGYGIAYRFEDPRTALEHMNAPAAGPGPKRPATIISPFPGEPRPRPRFASDRELFASMSSQAQLGVQAAKDQFGIALDSSAQSIRGLSQLLDGVRASAGDDGTQVQIAQWCIRAGSYLALVLCRQVGGQIGYTTHKAIRYPCVRMHGGRFQFPVLRVLDHISNGAGDDIGAWFDTVARDDASRTPRADDWVCNIPGYCDILLGRADLAGGGKLPLDREIPRDRLDFSPGSLGALDGYLDKIRALPQGERERVAGVVAVICGSYLGEVIRSRDRDRWIWVPYDDHAAANPGFASKRPRESSLLAFLDSDKTTTYPIAHVLGLIEGAFTTDCRAYAAALKEEDAAVSTPDAVESLPDDSGDPAFCPNCSHPMLSTATSCERCAAQFSDAANWRPLAQLPAVPSAADGTAPAAGASAATLGKWLLRAGHVCLLGPILHFAAMSAMGKGPIDGIAKLWAFVPFCYAAGLLFTWLARSRDKRAARIQSDGKQLQRFVDGPWDMVEYENLPVGLLVTHEPAKGLAVRGGPSGLPFSWVCSTSVAAVGEEVQLKAFCGTRWRDGRWVPANATGKPFSATDFEQWYGCPEARVQPGQSYTDASNWSGSSELHRSMTRWCYVGVTGDGRVVRGHATVHHAAALA